MYVIEITYIIFKKEYILSVFKYALFVTVSQQINTLILV